MDGRWWSTVYRLWSGNVITPGFILGQLAAHGFVEGFLNGANHRASLAGANFTEVDLADGDTFGSGPGQENFVGGAKFGQCYRAFLQRHAVLAGEGDDPVTGHAAQDAMALGVIGLEVPGGVDLGASESFEGIGLRIVRQYDVVSDNWTCRIDIQFGWAVLRPELISSIVGKAG